MNIVDKAYISASNWKIRKKEQLRTKKEEFLSDERGVSGIVAAVILVLVAVVLAIIFWDNISALVDKLWQNVNKSTDLKDVNPSGHKKVTP